MVLKDLSLFAVDQRLDNPAALDIVNCTSSQMLRRALAESHRKGGNRHTNFFMAALNKNKMIDRALGVDNTSFMLTWGNFINVTCGLMGHAPTTTTYTNMALEHSRKVCMIFQSSLLEHHAAAYQFLEAAMENSLSFGINEAISSLATFENNPHHVAEKVREADALFQDSNKSRSFSESTVQSIFAAFGAITIKLALLGSDV